MTDTRLHLTNAIRNVPLPSADEAKWRYANLPSRPYFIARSSDDVWVTPTDIDIIIEHRELRPVGKHPLCDVWTGTIDLEMHNYLEEQKVEYSSMDPVRMAILNEPTAPVIVWVGVQPDSLSAERGTEVACDLRRILLRNGIDDVHVEIRASTITPFAKMYKPAPPSDLTAQVREPFSTTLGIPISAENTPHIQGTATLFFTVASKPGRLFLLACRHVLFRVDDDDQHYAYTGSGSRRNVLLMSTAGFDARISDIEKKIKGSYMLIEHLKRRMNAAQSQSDKADLASEIDKAEKVIKEHKQFLVEAKEAWNDPKSRIIGHVVLSPPLLHGVGNGGFTQDFAVVEIDPTKIDTTNFIGNAIDLGTDMDMETLGDIMSPSTTDQHPFNYPIDRLIRFNNIFSVIDMDGPSPENMIVFKRGYHSGLTIGRLNDVRSVIRTTFKTASSVLSREVAVLPRKNTTTGFSGQGDSGAAVINGWGAVAGMLTSGDGFGLTSDVTYATPMTFLLERLEALGFPANLFPAAADIFV